MVNEWRTLQVCKQHVYFALNSWTVTCGFRILTFAVFFYAIAKLKRLLAASATILRAVRGITSRAIQREERRKKENVTDYFRSSETIPDFNIDYWWGVFQSPTREKLTRVKRGRPYQCHIKWQLLNQRMLMKRLNFIK